MATQLEIHRRSLAEFMYPCKETLRTSGEADALAQVAQALESSRPQLTAAYNTMVREIAKVGAKSLTTAFGIAAHPTAIKPFGLHSNQLEIPACYIDCSAKPKIGYAHTAEHMASLLNTLLGPHKCLGDNNTMVGMRESDKIRALYPSSFYNRDAFNLVVLFPQEWPFNWQDIVLVSDDEKNQAARTRGYLQQCLTHLQNE